MCNIVDYNLTAFQARLKEIHAGLLRQHLWQLQESDHQHLRQLQESNSNEHQISKEEVDVGHDDEYTEEAVEGMHMILH